MPVEAQDRKTRVALLIIKAAYDLTLRSARDLLDANLPVEEQAWIRNFIEENQSTVRGHHDLRKRKAGHFRFIEFHIQVDPKMTVESSHRLAQRLSRAVKEHLANSTVTIHIEPCTGDCADKCLAGCLLAVSERGEIAKRATTAND